MYKFSDETEKRKKKIKRIQQVLSELHTVAIVGLVIAITVVSVYVEKRLERLDRNDGSQEVDQEQERIQETLIQQVQEKHATRRISPKREKVESIEIRNGATGKQDWTDLR
jgi:beta-lactamase regulating signal transducer with metallopeptidase domain